MNKELAKKLKDAGFPQEYILGQWACEHGLDKLMENSCNCYGEMLAYASSLSELIEACGDAYFDLTKVPTSEQWLCKGGNKMVAVIGPTPEEAVAKLWLALQGKSKEE